jgi:general secretion pathway protein F/type IV pilus assembly protein PilC
MLILVRMALSHRKLSAWYRLLAQQLAAGVGFPGAIRSARGAGLPAATGEAMAMHLEQGGSIASALDLAGRWLPAADRGVISAAAAAGRVPGLLEHLSIRHAALGAAKLRLMLACAYPLAILHLGLVLLPIMRMIDWEKGFQWNPSVYAGMLAWSLGPLWLALAVLASLARRGSPLLRRVAGWVPFVGGYLRAQGLSDFAFTLASLLEAGVRIDGAWAAAGRVSKRRDLQEAAVAVAAAIQGGERPGTLLAHCTCFPPEFVALYVSGETSGQLDGNLRQIAAEQQQERAQRALTLATLFLPGVVFLALAALAAFTALRFYGGYLDMIGKLAE